MNEIEPRPRPLSMLRLFISNEASGGYVLMVAAALALITANSPLAASYFATLDVMFGFEVGGFVLKETLLHWINDGLMAVFFLLIGLEIKREVLDGQLSRPSRVLLPGLAAVAGVVLPALIYLGFNAGSPERAAGWAIPAATDIAFALGVLAILGKRVLTSLKIFLTAVAIIDDLAAILIIALFYTDGLHLAALAGAASVIAMLMLLNRLKVARLWPYILLGLVLWVLVLEFGIHATLAGVALAMTIPLRTSRARPDDIHSPLHRMEHALHKPVAFAIVPLFGFANAGLSFAGLTLADAIGPVPLGVALGLFIGKQVGVFAAVWAVVRLGWADLLSHAAWLQVYGVAVLCGVGFTMSLFVGGLAFDDPILLAETKLGVLAGSLASAVVGLVILRLARPETPVKIARDDEEDDVAPDASGPVQTRT